MGKERKAAPFRRTEEKEGRRKKSGEERKAPNLSHTHGWRGGNHTHRMTAQKSIIVSQ